MRALTMEELSFVSGGTASEDVEVVIVTGPATPPSTGGSGLGPYFTGFDPNKGGGGGKVDIALELKLDLNQLMKDADDSRTSVTEKGAQILNSMQPLGQASIQKGNTNSWAVIGMLNGIRYTITCVGANITSVVQNSRAGARTWQPSVGAPEGGFWRPF